MHELTTRLRTVFDRNCHRWNGFKSYSRTKVVKELKKVEGVIKKHTKRIS